MTACPITVLSTLDDYPGGPRHTLGQLLRQLAPGAAFRHYKGGLYHLLDLALGRAAAALDGAADA